MTAILKVDEIQDTSGNNIINENANTITIGKAGDTTNIVGTLQNDGAALVLEKFCKSFKLLIQALQIQQEQLLLVVEQEFR